jgi:hypothetical protein
MEQLGEKLEAAISRQLDRLGRGWKTTLGLFLMSLISAGIVLGKIPEALGIKLLAGASTLFGVGLYHKSTRD